MNAIAKNKVYTVLYTSGNFIVCNNGKYNETFKKDEVEVVFEKKEEFIPKIFINRSVFDNAEENLDGTETKNRRS